MMRSDRSEDEAPASHQRWRNRGRHALAIAGTLAIGTAGGIAARLLHMPLPWLLGPLLATAAVGLAGGPIHPVREARTFGQVIVGTSIGLQFTQALLVKLVFLTPLIFVVTLISMLIGAIGAVILMRLSKLDRTTAFFATTPGGVVEMMNIAERYGAEREPIAVAQTMRVSLIVLFAPLLVLHFAGGPGAGIAPPPNVHWLHFLGLLIIAGPAGYALARWRTPNAWMMGPMVVAGFCSAMGFLEGRAPDLLLIAAQVAMGTSLGTMFRHEFLTRLLRILLAAVLVVVFVAGSMAGLAVGVAYLLGVPVPNMVLALAPAGMAEMVITGKLLGLDATLITGFQLLRIVLIVILCRPAYWLFERLLGSGEAKGS
jgi:membrane AbrB-like protein